MGETMISRGIIGWLLAALLLPLPAAAQTWTTPRTWTTGELVTATIMNTYIRDNQTVLRAGGISISSQASGDLLCASSSSQIGRVAAGTSGYALVGGGASTCPAYSSVVQVTAGGNLYTTGDVLVDSTHKIRFDGSGIGDTYLVESSANVVDAYAGGVNVLRLTATGIGIGVNGSFTPSFPLDVTGGGASTTTGFGMTNYSSTGTGYDAYFRFRRSNSNTVGTLAGTVDGSFIGEMFFQAPDSGGSGWRTAGEISAAQDGTSGATYVPGKIAFVTTDTSGNSTTVLQARSSGNIIIGSSTAQRGTTVGSGALNIFNNTAPAGTLTNGVSFYSSSGNALVMDASGNAYKLTGLAEASDGNSGTAITINFGTNGPVQTVTRNGNCTYTLSAPQAGTYVLRFVHETGTSTAYSVTFSPTPKYSGGVAPTFTDTSAAVDLVTFYYNGSTWYAVFSKNMS